MVSLFFVFICFDYKLYVVMHDFIIFLFSIALIISYI